MGNRLSGLWCKKTTTLHINNDQKQTQISNDNNKAQRRKSGGANGSNGGNFRRLSLTSCVAKDNKKQTNKSTNSVISTIEQQYEKLINKTPVPLTDFNSKQYESQTLPSCKSKSKSKTTMKVNAQLPGSVKVSS